MPRPGQEQTTSPSPHAISRSVDSGLYRLAGGSVLKVIPGTSIGSLQLKMEWDHAPVFKYFGKPDRSDAAMCKHWAMWRWNNQRGEARALDIYAACDPDMDMRKSIRVIRIKGAPFLTVAGISDTTRPDALRNRLPGIVKLGEFSDPSGNTITLWDHVASGIAFECADSAAVIAAVLIHQPGKKITDLYLPFYTSRAASQTTPDTTKSDP